LQQHTKSNQRSAPTRPHNHCATFPNMCNSHGIISSSTTAEEVTFFILLFPNLQAPLLSLLPQLQRRSGHHKHSLQRALMWEGLPFAWRQVGWRAPTTGTGERRTSSACAADLGVKRLLNPRLEFLGCFHKGAIGAGVTDDLVPVHHADDHSHVHLRPCRDGRPLGKRRLVLA